eukprot:m.65628 g.65628  ORF g.65628 m.65628 type:complete len:228 (-) comp13999_c1_seq1:364-1047(-)
MRKMQISLAVLAVATVAVLLNAYQEHRKLYALAADAASLAGPNSTFTWTLARTDEHGERMFVVDGTFRDYTSVYWSSTLVLSSVACFAAAAVAYHFGRRVVCRVFIVFAGLAFVALPFLPYHEPGAVVTTKWKMVYTIPADSSLAVADIRTLFHDKVYQEAASAAHNRYLNEPLDLRASWGTIMRKPPGTWFPAHNSWHGFASYLGYLSVIAAYTFFTLAYFVTNDD